MESYELVTVWDGSARGTNRGQLLVPADPIREAPALSWLDADAPLVHQVSSACVDWMTIPGLAVLLSVEQKAVERALRSLKTRGFVEVRLAGDGTPRKMYRVRTRAEAA